MKLTNEPINDQLAQLDKIRQSLYMLSLEELPRPLDEQVHVAAYQLWYWLQQFVAPLTISELSKHTDTSGVEHSWPDNHDEIWEAHK